MTAAAGNRVAAVEAVPAALAGARCGASALPPPWLQQLEFAGPLVAAADRLAETARPPGEAVGIWSPAATRQGQPGLLLSAFHQLHGVQARG